MSSFERPLIIHHLTSQIGRLSDEQNEAMRKWAFVQMTREEMRAFDERSAQIADLVKQLETLR